MRSRGRDAIPSLFTLFGLLLALWGMVLATDGHFEQAAWVLFAAACVDVLDGTLARGLNALSPFGKQLDSLCDLVAAGVGPAFLLHQLYFDGWGFAGVVIAFAWMAFVAVRLARFNTSPDHPLYFTGVPCPIAAVIICQYGVFSRATWGDDGNPWVVVAGIAVLGSLMVSRVPYWKSTTVMPSQFRHHVFGPGFLATVALTDRLPAPGAVRRHGALGGRRPWWRARSTRRVTVGCRRPSRRWRRSPSAEVFLHLDRSPGRPIQMQKRDQLSRSTIIAMP